MKKTIDKLALWASRNSYIKSVYIFGSRARKDFKIDSDLDIALEIFKLPNDDTTLTTWIGERRKWTLQLEAILPYKVDLNLLDFSEDSSNVLNGVKNDGKLVYKFFEKA